MPPLMPALVTSPDFMRAWVAMVEDCRMGDAFAALPVLDPLELLSFVAARSERLRLETCVMIAPLHSAAIR